MQERSQRSIRRLVLEVFKYPRGQGAMPGLPGPRHQIGRRAPQAIQGITAHHHGRQGRNYAPRRLRKRQLLEGKSSPPPWWIKQASENSTSPLSLQISKNHLRRPRRSLFNINFLVSVLFLNKNFWVIIKKRKDFLMKLFWDLWVSPGSAATVYWNPISYIFLTSLRRESSTRETFPGFFDYFRTLTIRNHPCVRLNDRCAEVCASPIASTPSPTNSERITCNPTMKLIAPSYRQTGGTKSPPSWQKAVTTFADIWGDRISSLAGWCSSLTSFCAIICHSFSHGDGDIAAKFASSLPARIC